MINVVKRLSVFTFGVIVFISCSHGKLNKELDKRYTALLNPYEESLFEAKEMDLNLYAPENFERANIVLDDAREMAYYNHKTSEVEKKLDEGKNFLDTARSKAKLTKANLKDVIKARRDAINSGPFYAKYIKDADNELKILSKHIEENHIDFAIREKDSVRKMYEYAMVKNLQEVYLGETRSLIELMDQLDGSEAIQAERDALNTKIASVEKLIEKNKLKTTGYLDEVASVRYQAQRTASLVFTANWIKKQSLRDLTFSLDKDMNDSLAPLAYDDSNLMSYNEKVQILKEETKLVPFLMNELSSAQYENYRKKKMLAMVERQEARLRKVKKMFKKGEASVVIKGDDLVISLVGLNFAFDKATLPKGSDQILKKVVTAIDTMQPREVTILGHTDSKGSAKYNKELSKKRAENVDSYLNQNSNLNPRKIKVVGVGYRHPYSENKTKQGRKNNRRIDIVLKSVIKNT